MTGLLSLGLSACSWTTFHTANGTVKVDVDQKIMHMQTSEGNFDMGPNIALPINWPTDIAIYPGSKVELTANLTDSNGQMVQSTTQDKMQDIIDFYTKNLEGKGWTTKSTMKSEEMAMYSAAKDNREINIAVTTDEKERTIMLTTGTLEQ